MILYVLRLEIKYIVIMYMKMAKYFIVVYTIKVPSRLVEDICDGHYVIAIS